MINKNNLCFIFFKNYHKIKKLGLMLIQIIFFKNTLNQIYFKKISEIIWSSDFIYADAKSNIFQRNISVIICKKINIYIKFWILNTLMQN